MGFGVRAQSRSWRHPVGVDFWELCTFISLLLTCKVGEKDGPCPRQHPCILREGAFGCTGARSPWGQGGRSTPAHALSFVPPWGTRTLGTRDSPGFPGHRSPGLLTGPACVSPLGLPSLGAVSGYPISLRGGQGPLGYKIESRKGRRVARTRGIVSGVGSWGTSRAADSRPGQKEVRGNLMASMLDALYRDPGGTSGAGRADEPWWWMKDLLLKKRKRKGCLQVARVIS